MILMESNKEYIGELTFTNVPRAMDTVRNLIVEGYSVEIEKATNKNCKCVLTIYKMFTGGTYHAD